MGGEFAMMCNSIITAFCAAVATRYADPRNENAFLCAGHAAIGCFPPPASWCSAHHLPTTARRATIVLMKLESNWLDTAAAFTPTREPTDAGRRDMLRTLIG